MSDLERLIEIARALPPVKIHALLSVAEQMTPDVSEDGLIRKVSSAPAGEIDQRTAAELRAALAGRDSTIAHEDLKRELDL